MESHVILKNIARYPGVCPSMPDEFTVIGVTIDQAKCIADCLTNYEAGCDEAFYVAGSEDLDG